MPIKSLSERDPRKDFRKGDILSKVTATKIIRREIIAASQCDVEYKSGERFGWCWHTTMRRWAKDAEVIHKAADNTEADILERRKSGAAKN